MTEAEKVAAGLTEAQKITLRGGIIGWKRASYRAVLGYLERKGLVKLYSSRLDKLTPLGLEVRCILEKHDDGE